MRDTVYDGLLKRARATLHVDFVRWADQVNAERGRALEFEEILGYHLEQAHRYLAELGPLDDEGREIGEDAAGAWPSAGGALRARRPARRRGPAAPRHRAGGRRRSAATHDAAGVHAKCFSLGRFADARAIADQAFVEGREGSGNRRVMAAAEIVKDAGPHCKAANPA